MASLSKNYIRNLMRANTDLFISRECYPEVRRWLLEVVGALVRSAEHIALEDGRRTITLRDIAIAEINVARELRRIT